MFLGGWLSIFRPVVLAGMANGSFSDQGKLSFYRLLDLQKPDQLKVSVIFLIGFVSLFLYFHLIDNLFNAY